MFDNPQEVIDSTTRAITYLEVQIVGAAGFRATTSTTRPWPTSLPRTTS